MRTHTTLGEELVRRVRFLSPLVREVVACHHERWDGFGYPRQLAGPEIPLAARIFTVVDAFDAMIYRRAYREPRPVEEALEEIKRCAGSQFDPAIAAAFVSSIAHTTPKDSHLLVTPA
jgi:HD-GYP domain-containing protein (c-di-GMP phosphodiesterase class II)